GGCPGEHIGASPPAPDRSAERLTRSAKAGGRGWRARQADAIWRRAARAATIMGDCGSPDLRAEFAHRRGSGYFAPPPAGFARAEEQRNAWQTSSAKSTRISV